MRRCSALRRGLQPRHVRDQRGLRRRLVHRARGGRRQDALHRSLGRSPRRHLRRDHRRPRRRRRDLAHRAARQIHGRDAQRADRARSSRRAHHGALPLRLVPGQHAQPREDPLGPHARSRPAHEAPERVRLRRRASEQPDELEPLEDHRGRREGSDRRRNEPLGHALSRGRSGARRLDSDLHGPATPRRRRPSRTSSGASRAALAKSRATGAAPARRCSRLCRAHRPRSAACR